MPKAHIDNLGKFSQKVDIICLEFILHIGKLGLVEIKGFKRAEAGF
jgi:hypothetical protein